jgi:hypothetical protein
MKITFFEHSQLSHLFPPVPAKKLVPDWYREKESAIENVQRLSAGSNFTVKKCVPVLDYITSGYIIQNHADILIKRSWNDTIGEDIVIDFKLPGNYPISFHHVSQMPITRNGRLKKIAKFNGVWGIKTPPGYSCLFYQPEYFNETRFKVFPAIVDTDQYTDPVGFPFMFEDTTATEEYVIEAGTPLVCVFPFKREDWEIEIKEPETHSRSATLMKTIWESAYRKFMHTKKSYK